MNGEAVWPKSNDAWYDLKRGDIVVMDNVNVHKVEGVRDAIEAAQRNSALFRPSSPDLNPIELSYSAFKAFLRKYPSGPEALPAALDSSCDGCPPKRAPTSSLMQDMLRNRC